MNNFKFNNSHSKHNLIIQSEITCGRICGFLLTVTMLYYLLLVSHVAFLSLYFLLNFIEHLPSKEQFAAISLLPIYLAILIFGGSSFGAWAGHWIQYKIKKILAEHSS